MCWLWWVKLASGFKEKCSWPTSCSFGVVGAFGGFEALIVPSFKLASNSMLFSQFFFHIIFYWLDSQTLVLFVAENPDMPADWGWRGWWECCQEESLTDLKGLLEPEDLTRTMCSRRILAIKLIFLCTIVIAWDENKGKTKGRTIISENFCCLA